MTEMTTRAFANAIGTDPKTLRKFLRDSTPRDEHPGKGGRWVLPGSKAAIAKSRRQFAEWQAEQAAKAAQRAIEAQKDAEASLATLDDAPADPDDAPDEVTTESE